MSAAQISSQPGVAESAGAAVLKGSPPVAVTGAMLSGMDLNSWVAVATLAYVLLQAAYLVWKWVRELRAKKADANV